jgi:glycosyltransferase involved in cell wall biosynthesis
MRLVFYSYSVTMYGAPASMLNLLQGLVKDNQIEIYVVVPGDGPLTHELSKLPIQIIRLPFFKWVYHQSLLERKQKANRFYAWLWFYKNSVQKILLNLLWFPAHLIKMKRLNPNIIYTNTSLSPMGPVVAKALGVKSIWHHRETINDLQTDFFIEWSSGLSHKILNLPAAHLFASYYLQSAYDVYITTGKPYVVLNGVEEGTSIVSRKLDRKRPIRLGMVGRINPQKGQQEVIESISHFSDSQLSLVLFGGGEKYYVDRLRSFAPAQVFFEGFVPQKEIYNNIDFLVVNARNESFGRVVAEAYSYGVPVVALCSGALPELVIDNETGFIFLDKKSLLQVLKQVTLMDNSTYQQMSTSCLKQFQEHYTIAKYARNITNILKTVNNDH